ncbi:MAG: aldehyde dehydrogenase family protein [Nanoarchaeota archaeon]
MIVKEINPSNEKIYKEFEATSFEEIDDIIKNSRENYVWKNMLIEDRIKIIKNIVYLLEENKRLLAETMANEMGKAIKSGIHEVDIIKKRISDYCDMIPNFIEDETIFDNENEKNIVVFEPIGTVAVITPWNAPVFLPLASIIPALITGNSVIFKPSSNAIDTGIKISEIVNKLKDFGFPNNIFQIIIPGRNSGEYLVKNNIDLTVLVGGLKAGQEVMKNSAENIKKFILELGGKDPAIVLNDADIDNTAKQIVKTSTMYTGQVCFGVERVYAQESIYENLVNKIIEENNKIKAGNPLDEKTDIGPFAIKSQLDKVLDHLNDAKNKGAKLYGGEHFKIDGKGYFMNPGVLINVNHSMKIMKEETFGPITPIMKFSNIEEAINLANDSDMGLTASIWTKNLEKGKNIARKINAGTVEINRHGLSKAGCPWGGYKKSGFGRIYSKEGIRNFCNTKHIWIIKNQEKT